MPKIRLRLAVLPVLAGLVLPGLAFAGGGDWQTCQGSGTARSACSVSCNGESRRQSCGDGEMCECQCAPRPQCRCRSMDQQTQRPGVPDGASAAWHRPGRQG